MDPFACLMELLGFIAEKQWQEANIRAEALRDWITAGNGLPHPLSNQVRCELPQRQRRNAT